MPTYEYRCPLCNHQFELRQSFSAESVTTCPNCKSEAHRILQSPFIVYKASGFYTSDQRRNGRGNYWYNQAAKEDQGGAAPSSDSGAPSSDSGAPSSDSGATPAPDTSTE